MYILLVWEATPPVEEATPPIQEATPHAVQMYIQTYVYIRKFICTLVVYICSLLVASCRGGHTSCRGGSTKATQWLLLTPGPTWFSVMAYDMLFILPAFSKYLSIRF